MAILKGNIQFIGGLGNVSSYTMRGSDKIILRTKGGASRDKIKHDACFVNTRKVNKEWSGCSKTGTALRTALHPLKHLADYNISGPLNAIAKKIQKTDADNPIGKRSVALHRCKSWLNGFSFNTSVPITDVIKVPIQFTILRNEGIATITIPGLMPGINFVNRFNRPLCRFTASFVAVPDFIYNSSLNDYESQLITSSENCYHFTTQWVSAFESQAERQMELKIENIFAEDDPVTFVLAIGIEFGNLISYQIAEAVKYSGSAMILGTA